jgi:hypothetical protein
MPLDYLELIGVKSATLSDDRPDSSDVALQRIALWTAGTAIPLCACGDATMKPASPVSAHPDAQSSPSGLAQNARVAARVFSS